MPRPSINEEMREFAKRAKSILWRADAGGAKVQYARWNERIKNLQASAGYNNYQAIVQASKDFPCLKKLFREYDVTQYDPNPNSHPDVPLPVSDAERLPIECQGLDASYRENLNWAMQAAGEKMRTGESPKVCPNDQAYYLYVQATENSKEFLQRLGQVESKGDSELDEQRSLRRADNRSIREIEEMLIALDQEKIE